MADTKNHKVYDDKAKEAAHILLEQFWVIREDEPDKYQLIREREHVLQAYFNEKLGYRLIVHRFFAKLEKIPATPESWMGIALFQHSRDYALLCCLLAYLESRSVDEQFLLSALCEELRSLYPAQESLDWTHYEHRKSLIRVMQYAKEQGIVKVVDGDIDGFRFVEQHEVLYEVPVISRYFMRSYPKDLFQYDTLESLLQAEWAMEDEGEIGIRRRHRVYRQLLLSPGFYKEDADDSDFLYLRNYRNRIRDDMEKHLDYQFELYSHTAMLTRSERTNRHTLFPDQKGISDVTLFFAAFVYDQFATNQLIQAPDGTCRLTRMDYDKLVIGCRQLYGHGWSKQYRELSDASLQKELLAFMIEWKMARVDDEMGLIALFPILIRTAGVYPNDYKTETEETN